MMFLVREALLVPVWISFVIQLLLTWAVFSARTRIARRMQRFYEAVVLRKPSDHYSTSEMIWADRLAELRQFTKYDRYSLWFGIVEPLLWLSFSAFVYFLLRHGT
jgi:hypothetical protein